MKKTEVISFNEFMNPKPKVKKSEVKTYSFVPFSVTAMLDPTILTVAGIVLAVVFIEKVLQRIGAEDIADTISGIFRFILPTVFFISLAYFFTTLSL